MQKKLIAFACAAAFLVGVPFVVNALAAKLAKTPNGEHQIRAFLYFCVNAMLLITIFYLWLLEGQ